MLHLLAEAAFPLFIRKYKEVAMKSFMIQKTNWLFLLGMATLFLLSPHEIYAGREFEEWDTLPRIQDIVFSKTSIGFISQGDSDWNVKPNYSYFVMDRVSRVFQQVDGNSFHESFSDRLHPKPYEDINGQERYVIRGSNGKEFQVDSAYCSEGENQHHKLWLDGKFFRDIVDPCLSITAVEMVGNQLWFGTAYWGEYGEYPGDGIIIQSLQKPKQKPKLIKKVAGLTGNLVRVIRMDTENDNVWVATEWGLNEVNRKFHVVSSYYFFEDFERVSGNPTVFLSSSPKSSNAFAVISKALSVRDSKAFYEAVKALPQTLQDKFTLYGFFMYSLSDTDFLPLEMNVLLPFFMEAAQSNQGSVQSLALSKVCDFKDKKVYGLMIDMIDMEGSHPFDYSVKACLTKYATQGLVENDIVMRRIERLTERMRQCLTSMRQSSSLPSCTKFVVEDAETLKTIDSNRGMQIINEYFQTFQWYFLDSAFYDLVFSKLYNEDELIPAALKGLEKTRTALEDIISKTETRPKVDSKGFANIMTALKGLYHERINAIHMGCKFFNMRHHQSKDRYSSQFSETILLLIERSVNPINSSVTTGSHVMGILGLGELGGDTKKECTEALESQLANDKVKEDFMKEIYPGLSDDQKKLADDFIVKKRD
jgi:hypothetical protein